jgi:hypothetical protein
MTLLGTILLLQNMFLTILVSQVDIVLTIINIVYPLQSRGSTVADL